MPVSPNNSSADDSFTSVRPQRASLVLAQLREELLGERNERGHWTGELSASALSTATAVSALSVALLSEEPPFLRGSGDPLSVETRERYSTLVHRGTDWLSQNQNPDGGFGDTDRSHSNIATSYLVLAAWSLSERALSTSAPDLKMGSEEFDVRMKKLCGWIDSAGGIPALRQRYGKDKTFVVPILTNLAIAGVVSWKEVASLPFEAAVFPQSMYRFVGMPVVSYAIPALVAIGQVKFLLGGGCLPPWSWVRRSAIRKSMKALRNMQPESGGYLEATPLTAFVVMSLAASGRRDHTVTQNGLRFLEESVTDDGSWPIDTNLASWVTSLATLALVVEENKEADQQSVAMEWSNQTLIDWQLSCQYLERHPFTGAEPGGWGWTDLSGAVPDADDTPGAMLSLLCQRDSIDEPTSRRIKEACERGADWLLGLQNRDGGWPTFCRGWGKLPFDRSSTDLTAHAIRAIRSLQKDNERIDDLLEGNIRAGQLEKAIQKGLEFLRARQQPDGSWLPLWFGNQDRPDEDNPIYGTAKVLVHVDPALGQDAILSGIQYLLRSRNSDGGWGGGPSVTDLINECMNEFPVHGSPEGARHGEITSSVEETALAVEALASLWPRLATLDPSMREPTRAAILSGTDWLIDATEQGRHQVAWPIGFYFAKLWYYERLYPLIFATAAMGRVIQTDKLLR